ncbi:MAG: hypothetical protein Q3999_08445 [Buchananella hordeovulneris]|nr:hypothetical protein [Buchananella hordeovulneris]
MTTTDEWRDQITTHATTRTQPAPVDELDPTTLTQARRDARRAEAETWTDAWEAGIPHTTIATWAGEHPHSVRAEIEARRLARLPHEYVTARGTRLTRRDMFVLGALHERLAGPPGFDLAHAETLARWAITTRERGRGVVFTADGQIFTTLTHQQRWVDSGYFADHRIDGVRDHSADGCVSAATRQTGLAATWLTIDELLDAGPHTADTMPPLGLIEELGL